MKALIKVDVQKVEFAVYKRRGAHALMLSDGT
jgi:hypothetical protein